MQQGPKSAEEREVRLARQRLIMNSTCFVTVSAQCRERLACENLNQRDA